MARVTVEDCIDKVDNRFDLVLMASHRARAISSGRADLRRARQRQEPGRRAARNRRTKLAPNDLKRGRHSRAAEAGRGRRAGGRGRAADDPRRNARRRPSRRRGAVRPHDRGRLAARPRGHGAAAGARRRRRISAAFAHAPSPRLRRADRARGSPHRATPLSTTIPKGLEISLGRLRGFDILPAENHLRGNSSR